MKNGLWKRALSALTAVAMISGTTRGQIFSALTEPAITASAEDSTDYVQIGDEETSSYTIQGYPVTCGYPYGWSEQIYTAEEVGDISEIDALAFCVYEGISIDYEMSLYLMDTDLSVFDENINGLSVDDASCVWTGTPDFKEQGWSKIDFETTFEHDPEMNLAVITVYTCTEPSSSAEHSFRAFSIDSNETLNWMTDDVSEALPGGSISGRNVHEKNIIRLYAAEDVDQVTVGTVTDYSSTSFPLNSYYNYGFSEQIYTAEELGNIRKISEMGWYVVDPMANRKAEVYLMDTDKDCFANGTDYVSIDEATKVFEGTMPFEIKGWNYIYLDEEFVHDPTKNLVVIVINVTGSFTSGLKCATYEDAEKRNVAICKGWDNERVDPGQLSASVYESKNVMIFWNGDVKYSTITYYPNGAEESSYTQMGLYGMDCALVSNRFTRDRYEFISWNTAPDGSGKSYSDEDMLTPLGDIDLYAQWEKLPDYLHQIGKQDSVKQTLPVNFWYKYGFAQQIYTAEEIGDIPILTSIGFLVTNPIDADLTGTMYLMDTDKASFDNSLDWVRLDGATKVYEGAFPSTNGWVTLPFDAPYSHNTAKNLLLIFINTTGNDYNNFKFATYNSTPNCTAYCATDSIYTDPDTHTGGVTQVSYKNVIQLTSYEGETITVTYNSNGSGEENIVHKFIKGSSFSLLDYGAFEREGYYLTGWNTKTDGSGTAYELGETITGSTDLTVYAQWAPKPYITYNSNDGTDQEIRDIFVPGDERVVKASSYKRNGYYIESWNTSADGSGTRYEIGDVITPAGSITLFAQWKKGVQIVDMEHHIQKDKTTVGSPFREDQKYSYSVQIHSASDIGDNPLLSSISFYVKEPGNNERTAEIYIADIDSRSTSAEFPCPLSLSEMTMVYSGSVTFDQTGWIEIPFNKIFVHDTEKNLMIVCVDKTGTAASSSTVFTGYGYGAYYCYSEYETSLDDEDVNGESVYRNEIRLGIAPESEAVTITFSPNGGEGDDLKQLVVKDTSTALRLNKFRRKGYHFTDWNTKADGSGTSYSDGNTVTRTAPLTLYAQWEECPVITYHANRGKGEDQWQNIDRNDVKFLDCSFIKKGYVFESWNTKPDGSEISYNAGEDIDFAYNVDLYAQWKFATDYDFSSDPSNDGWRYFDIDGDGYTWIGINELNSDNLNFHVHSGNDGDSSIIASASYSTNSGPLSPDNWAVSPAGRVKTDGSATLSLWARGQDASYAAEHFAIYAAPVNNVDLEHFDPAQWTMVSQRYEADGDWKEYTADLSDFAGKEVYVAIRHYDTYDMYWLNIDDLSLPFDNVINMTFKHNCGFNENLALYYAVPKASLDGYENIELTVDQECYKPGASEPEMIHTVITNYTETTIGGAEMYMFEYKGITATDLNCNVKAVITAEKDGIEYKSKVDEYSIQQYVLNRLENSSNEQYKKLLVDLLNYGATAQAHFNKNAAHPANEVLTEEQLALGTQTDPELADNCNEITVSGAKATFNGKNINFDNNVVITLRIKLPANADMRKIKLKVKYNTSSGAEITKTVKGSFFTKSDEYWLAEVKGIAMTDFRSVMDIAVYSGSKQISNTLQYSVESYVYNRLNNESTSDSFKDLLREMMKFGISAETHFS